MLCKASNFSCFNALADTTRYITRDTWPEKMCKGKPRPKLTPLSLHLTPCAHEPSPQVNQRDWWSAMEVFWSRPQLQTRASHCNHLSRGCMGCLSGIDPTDLPPARQTPKNLTHTPGMPAHFEITATTLENRSENISEEDARRPASNAGNAGHDHTSSWDFTNQALRETATCTNLTLRHLTVLCVASEMMRG